MRRLVRCVFPVALVALIACGGGGSETPECEDNVDNDGDGFTDETDPACIAGEDLESEDPETACSNGIDDDNDGLIDFPDDVGCDNAEDNDEFGSGAPDCNDGIDNDGDGKIDFPNDPGCLAEQQDSEVDDCPSGPNCPECGDGVDNDFDGLTDYAGNDSDCTSASDTTELDVAADACGNGTSVTPLPQSGTLTGNLGTGVSNLMPVQCTGAVGTGTEAVYIVTVAEAETLVATTDDPLTTVDTVLYLRRACTNTTTELACANDISAVNTSSTLTVDLDPGTYFLVVDARAPGSSGGYVLRVTRHNALGEACAVETECAPDHVCRIPAGGTASSCEKAVCGDGRDDDGDGDIDFPDDPGCTSATDGDEVDTCPGAGCPDCANGLDDDGDSAIDYPADTSCASASATSEFNCTGGDAVRLFSSNVTGQTTSALANDYTLTCGTNGRDEVWLMRVNTDLAEIRIDTIGSSIDAAIALRRASCTGFDLQCDDDSAGAGDASLFLVDIQAGDYYVIVDDKNTSGTYNLNVRGVYANGAACDPTSTAFQCGSGYICSGVAPGATCQPTACNDTVDEDGDGFPGFPTDPGCVSSTDDDESDTCPGGVGCPACGNELDDDNDTFIDYPLDPGCGFAAQSSELAPCTSVDPVLNFTGNLTNVTTLGARLNDVAPSCGTNGRDEIYRLVVPRPLTNLRIDTLGSPLDTTVSLRVASCNSADLTCDDNTGLNGDSLINRTNVAVGEYFIIVEGAVTNPGAYNLNVQGTLQVGASCDPASTLYVCPSAHACVGAPGLETCEPAACNDAIDQDGDGFPGYPTDPGCVNISDPDESDDCPVGPGCAQCGNQVNDDGDLWIDYPMDPGCTAASDTSELQCLSADPILPATNVVGASTVGRGNDIALSCGTNGRDEVYRFVVDRLLTQLRVDTIDSALDTVVGIRRNDCASADLTCNDDGAGSGDSLAIINSPAFGEYYIVVDDRNVATPGTYNLNIKAVLPVGAACTPADPIYICPDAYACGGVSGAETCRPGPCNDTLDADGDGAPGFPTDPGCTSIADNDESDNCPTGPGCPICADDLDNDGDGLIDYPADPTCASASDTVEAATCSSADPIRTYSGPVVGADTATLLSDVTLSCGTNGRDEIYRLMIDRPVTRLVVDTVGSVLDTVVGIRRTNCNGTDLACDDDTGGNGDSIATMANVNPGEYFIIVEDRNVTGGGIYDLRVTAELPTGAACTPGDAIYACPEGSACIGAAGAETCVPSQCADTVDQDGDGHGGYPDDPGCTDVSDDDESDPCPATGCPVCGDGLDNDGDGFTDYPLEASCESAAGANEASSCVSTDPLLTFTGNVVGASASTRFDDVDLSCGSNGRDEIFRLNLLHPLAQLRIDTIGSSLDAVAAIRRADCNGVDLGCNDDGAGNLDALVVLTNVTRGEYFVILDDRNATGTYNLNIAGTAAPGGRCVPGNQIYGCDAIHICTGAAGAETCQ